MRRIAIAIVGLVSVCVYMALGIWGFGSWHGCFANGARTGLIVVIVALTIASAFTNSSGLGSGVREDKSNRWVLLPLILAGFVLAWLTPYLDGHNIWVMGGDPVRWVGLALCAGGGTLRLVPVFVLGLRFSGLVAIQSGHTLKTDGVYKVIRHPSYLGLLISTLGWALVFRCVVPGLLLTAVIAAILVARMNSEEKLLADQFGDDYAAYRKRTWRMIPLVY